MPNFDDGNVFWQSPYEGILKAREEVINFGVKVDTYFFDQFRHNRLFFRNSYQNRTMEFKLILIVS